MDKKELGLIIHSVLAPLGFKKRGLSWTYYGKEINEKIWLQKSCYGDYYYFHYDYIINAMVKHPSEVHTYVDYSKDGHNYQVISELLNFENNLTDEERKEKLTEFLNTRILPVVGKIDTEEMLREELVKRENCPLRWDIAQHLQLSNKGQNE